MPELLRIHGEILRSRVLPAEAEAAFEQSLSLARRQGALWWELRTAPGLAGLWCQQGRRREAAALLVPVLDRFEGTLDMDDPRAARNVFDEASGHTARPAISYASPA
jgi:predicted ATPase